MSADPLTNQELATLHTELPNWRIVESTQPGDRTKTRVELRRIFKFKTFPAAIDFMQSAVPQIESLNHHPRWENQWRSLTIYLSTWNIGRRISRNDVKLAQILDRQFEKGFKP
jgi:pterin-4a-carbinolamine dehydratase